MKKINFIKAGLDILMLIAFVLLFNTRIIVPMVFHQVVGIAIGVVVLVHIILNFKFVKQVTLKLFSSKIKFRTKFGYIIDALLLISFIIIIITGIMMSKLLFPNSNSQSMTVRTLHVSLSYFALLLLGIHIGLHWNWAVNVFKSVFRISKEKKMNGIIAKLLVVLIFAFGAYNIYSTNFLSRTSSIVNVFSGSQSTTQGGSAGGHADASGGDQHSAQGGSAGGHTDTAGGSQPTMQGGSGGGHADAAGGDQHSAQGGAQTGGNSPSAFSIIYKYISVISAFIIITFYLDKLLVKRKVVNQVQA